MYAAGDDKVRCKTTSSQSHCFCSENLCNEISKEIHLITTGVTKNDYSTEVPVTPSSFSRSVSHSKVVSFIMFYFFSVKCKIFFFFFSYTSVLQRIR